ncbi:MAG: glycosyltransferase [Acidobacteria bacterium]|nr:glycosyltransferase [Acidobacteriota bacterium]
MASLAVVTSSPPRAEGGHLVLARTLVDAARACGHDADLVVTADYGFGRLTRSYCANWMTDVSTVNGRRIDQVISLRYPSFAVRHPRHVCWLNHTMREYYDLWPQFKASIYWRNQIKEGTRRAILHGVDRWLLAHHVTKLAAISHTVARRLATAFDLRADVVHPPPPARAYRCEGYGDYVFAVSRLIPLKRLDLLVRALAEPPARAITAVVAGDGPSRSELATLARDLGVAHRIQFLGTIDDEAIADHLSRCRAVCFTPYDEDYGFVTVEAFASWKPVITCVDSGGAAELVRDGENGIVCEATPAALAVALARLAGDQALAERLGASAAAHAATMTWEAAVQRLVIV